MKIAIITPYWNPPSFRGGISRVVYELRKVWSNAGHTVHVFASATTGDTHNGIFKLPCPPMPYRTVLNNLFLRGHNILRNYDIIFPQSAIACIFLPRGKTVPFIHTLSDIEHKSLLRPWRYGHQILEKWALKGIPKCFALDSKTAQSLEARCGMKIYDILRVNNGVDHHKFSPGLPGNKCDFKIITAGRFIPRKHFDKMIHIAAEFIKLRNNVTLQLAGDGDMRDILVSLSRQLGVEKAVQFLGQLKEDELINHFREASVFMFTSEAEGMPMVLLEAQSCGLPVITSAFESARILVKDESSGFIIDGYESSAWISKLNLLFEDDNLRGNFSRSARQRVLNSFTWEQTSPTLLNCFRDVLKGQR